MHNYLMKNKKMAYILMTLLVCMWGFDYIAAKTALTVLSPMTLIFFKYGIAALILFIFRLVKHKEFPLRKQHLILLILCSIFGEILYYWAEYSAMDYIPVSIITIILSFVPMGSIVVEIFLYKKKPTITIVIGIIVCIIGVSLVIGVDLREILAGKWIGYLLAFGAVAFWNAYLFLTKRLSGEYDSFDLAFMQLACTTTLTFPFAIFNFPQNTVFTPEIIGAILYLGSVSACMGFVIYVLSISVLGPTPCALYSNFLPVTSSIFGWIFLGEALMPLQMIGGAIVICSGAIVIWKKGQLDKKYEVIKEEHS